MRKLSAKQIKALQPGDKVLSENGQEVEFVEYDERTYSMVVQFPDRNKTSRILSIYELPKK